MDNIDVVRKVEEAWDTGKTDELDQYFAPDFNNESAVPMLPKGLEGAKIAHQMTAEFMPDRKVDIVDIFGTGDKVAIRQRVTFTNTKGVPWLGAGPNDAKIAFDWFGIYTLKKGKIVGHSAAIDGFSFLAQLGLWSPPQMG